MSKHFVDTMVGNFPNVIANAKQRCVNRAKRNGWKPKEFYKKDMGNNWIYIELACD